MNLLISSFFFTMLILFSSVMIDDIVIHNGYGIWSTFVIYVVFILFMGFIYFLKKYFKQP